MTLLELITSLDARGISIEVSPKFVSPKGQGPTREELEAAKAYRVELMRIALARESMDKVQPLESQWAGYPARRTDELEDQLTRAKNTVLYLLPEDLPWSIVARLRPDGTTILPSTAMERVA